MCTLYSITTNQEAIRRLFGVTHDSADNLPPMLAVFPDWEAPAIRQHRQRPRTPEDALGLPNPPRTGGINTNIRNQLATPRKRSSRRSRPGRCAVVRSLMKFP